MVATASRMKGKFTDMAPVNPGNFTRNRDAAREMISSAANPGSSTGCQWRSAFATTAAPANATSAIKAFEMGDNFAMAS